MMRKIPSSLLLVGVLLAAPAALSAQAGVYFGVQGGLSLQQPSLEGVDFGTDTSFVYGLKAGVKLLMFVIEAQYFQAAHNISLEQAASLDWNGRSVDYSHLGIDLKYLLSLLVVHPYLSVGYGYYTADIHAVDKDRDKGYNFGAGVEVMLGSKIGLNAEGRYHHVKLSITDLGLKVGDFTLTAGLNFYF
jgi:hypothetical protein